MLCASFLAGLAAPVRAQVATSKVALDDALGDALIAQWETSAATWPDITIAPEHFARELARRLGAPATVEAVMTALAQARGSDVYLAIACCAGDSAAINRLDEIVGRELQRAAIKLRASPDQTVEIHAELRRILLVDEHERGAALREYAGRGDLRGYVRVMATRALIRAINRARREVVIDDAEFFDRVAPRSDPELGMLRTRYRETVDAGLRAALERLDDRSRALLRYQLIDGWSIDQVGKLYGVHRATAARWLAEARHVLGETIRAELAERLQIATDEVDSVVRLVQSRVDMSLDRLLGPETR